MWVVAVSALLAVAIISYRMGQLHGDKLQKKAQDYINKIKEDIKRKL